MTPYQRIVRADKRGTGLRLSVEEVRLLGNDHAIHARAEWDDMGRDAEDDYCRALTEQQRQNRGGQ